MEATDAALADVLPSFRAAKLTGDNPQLVGMDDIVQLQAAQVMASLNDGDAWSESLGKAVVDWQTSFPAEADETDTDGDGKIDPAGFELATSSASIYLDAEARPYLRATADNALLQIDQFVHITGDLAFEKGSGQNVDIATGLPDNLDEVDATLHAQLTDAKTNHGLQLSDDFSTISDLAVDTMSITATGVSAFVGINGPYKTDTNNDGDLSDETPNADATGIWLPNTDLGFLQMEATDASLADVLPSFRAAKLSGDNPQLVGMDDIMKLQVAQVLASLNDVTLERIAGQSRCRLAN
ncbi:MAG: hypothetical protein R3C28_24865 [Pirellulaceae bacterium]